MTGSDQPDWSEIRRLYVNGEPTVANIAEQHGISVQRIHQRARREDWPRRSSSTRSRRLKTDPDNRPRDRKSARVSSSPKAPQKRSIRSSAPSLKARRALVRRLYKAIDTKLQQMERRMAHDMATAEANSDTTAADHERDTRAIGSLIANLSRVTEMEADLERIPGATATPIDQQADRQLADEAERFRREVAERLARLVRPT